PRSLKIEDRLSPHESTRQITWQMMTHAEVEPHAHGATLRQNGESLELINHSHPDSRFETVSLDPPPHRHDKHIEGLKRIELRLPVNAENGETTIRVELCGQ
ncbi:MAG: hypothetical protein ACNA77_11560, partial [Opitutales bacterium]